MKHIKTHFFKNELFSAPKFDISGMTPKIGRRMFKKESAKEKEEKVTLLDVDDADQADFFVNPENKKSSGLGAINDSFSGELESEKSK